MAGIRSRFSISVTGKTAAGEGLIIAGLLYRVNLNASLQIRLFISFIRSFIDSFRSPRLTLKMPGQALPNAQPPSW